MPVAQRRHSRRVGQGRWVLVACGGLACRPSMAGSSACCRSSSRSEGQTLGPTARVVWDRLVELADGLECAAMRRQPDAAASAPSSSPEGQPSSRARRCSTSWCSVTASESADGVAKDGVAFAARRRAIERLGLPQVRDFRLAQLAGGERLGGATSRQREHGLPELSPMLLVAITDAEGAP
jgi:hypothetical protein